MWDKTKIPPQLQEQAKNIRLIATDLDGTLLRQLSTLSPRTAQAVQAVRARGIAFTVCTGRSLYELGDLPRQLGLDEPVICRNGAEIADPTDGRALFHRLIPAEEGAAFIRYCLNEHIDVCLTTQNEAFFPQGSYFSEFFGPTGRSNAFGPWLRLLDQDTPLEALAHYKIILLKTQPKYQLARAFAEKLPGIRIIGASPEIDDLIARDANKGDGLRWVTEHLGLDSSQCCAFGDFSNDVPMFRYAGLSFAMDNADHDVKAAAGYVAPSHLDDGVAQVLETLWL